MRAPTTVLFLVLHVVVVILFIRFCKYRTPSTVPLVVDAVDLSIALAQPMHCMMAIGFAFTLTFLHRGTFTAIGHSLLIIVFVILWGILNQGFWVRVVQQRFDTLVSVGILELIQVDFAATAVLLSFGAVAGRFSADQLLIMAFIEVVCYSANAAVASELYKAADVGGGMIVHLFGSLFGLVVSLIVEIQNPTRDAVFVQSQSTISQPEKVQEPKRESSVWIGTLLLWCFFPAFNSVLAGSFTETAIVNSVLSISSSALLSFYLISLSRSGRFGVVEVQGASVTGGVIVASTANMTSQPFGAIILGSVAAGLSVFGFRYVQGHLKKYDTVGVLSRHLMPAVVGALASIILAAMVTDDTYHNAVHAVFPLWGRDGKMSRNKLARYQLWTLLTTIAFALGGGAVTGAILRFLTPLHLPHYYCDDLEWKFRQESVGEPEKGNSGTITPACSPMEPQGLPHPLRSNSTPAATPTATQAPVPPMKPFAELAGEPFPTQIGTLAVVPTTLGQQRRTPSVLVIAQAPH